MGSCSCSSDYTKFFLSKLTVILVYDQITSPLTEIKSMASRTGLDPQEIKDMCRNLENKQVIYLQPSYIYYKPRHIINHCSLINLIYLKHFIFR